MAEVNSNELQGKGYDKLFFLWYFDDGEGYGIEIMGMRKNAENDPGGKAVFHSLVKWSFGHGTKARDLRRAWGEYVAEQSTRNGSMIPEEILSIKLQYSPNCEPKLAGDLPKIEYMLSEKNTKLQTNLGEIH